MVPTDALPARPMQRRSGIALRLESLKSWAFSYRPTTYRHLYLQTIATLAANGSNMTNARVHKM
jgi:hypothetical protein